MARRYVHISNFEVAHDIKLTGKEKPLKAYEYVTGLNENSDAACLKYLKDLLGDNIIFHDNVFVESLPE